MGAEHEAAPGALVVGTELAELEIHGGASLSAEKAPWSLIFLTIFVIDGDDCSEFLVIIL